MLQRAQLQQLAQADVRARLQRLANVLRQRGFVDAHLLKQRLRVALGVAGCYTTSEGTYLCPEDYGEDFERYI